MSKINIKLPTNMSRTLGKVTLKAKKASPEVALVVGAVGIGVSMFMMCKATLKVNDVLDKHKETMDTIHEAAENTELNEEYTQEDAKKDTFVAYRQTGIALAKLYGPSIALAALSMASIITSHKIMKNRNMALAAANASLMKSFKDYRDRVKEQFGEEVEKGIRYDIKAKDFEKTVVDEKGKEKKQKETAAIANNVSDYAIFFDDSCAEHSHSLSHINDDMTFLKIQESYFNNLLIKRGYLFLNDVYDALGHKPTKAGQCVGWIYSPKNPLGDNRVILDIFQTKKENGNGFEDVLIVDFNVDGDILSNF